MTITLPDTKIYHDSIGNGGDGILIKQCAREGCDNKFVPRAVNAKYCTPACTRKATNEKGMAKYWAKKHRLDGSNERVCSVCQDVKLSRYNATEICGGCETAVKDARRKVLLQELGLV